MFSFDQKRSSVLFAIIAVFSLVLVRIAEAQSSAIPACADNCFSTAAQAAGCSNGNTTCLCQASFMSAVLQCSAQNCTAPEQAEVSEALDLECQNVISTPPFQSSTSTFAFTSGSTTVTDVVTLTTTLPGGSSLTITVTVPSVTPSPPLSFTTSLPIIGSSSSSSSTPSSSSATGSVTSSNSLTATTTVSTSAVIPPLSIASLTTFTSTFTPGNGVSTAPAGSSTTSSASNGGGRLGAHGILCLGLGLAGAMAMLDNAF